MQINEKAQSVEQFLCLTEGEHTIAESGMRQHDCHRLRCAVRLTSWNRNRVSGGRVRYPTCGVIKGVRRVFRGGARVICHALSAA